MVTAGIVDGAGAVGDFIKWSGAGVAPDSLTNGEGVALKSYCAGFNSTLIESSEIATLMASFHSPIG